MICFSTSTHSSKSRSHPPNKKTFLTTVPPCIFIPHSQKKTSRSGWNRDACLHSFAQEAQLCYPQGGEAGKLTGIRDHVSSHGRDPKMAVI